ncbi:tRNA pseudouridine synthase A [Ehrlichia ruminantium str. Gardel]|uniref:tRNA pseudouridine synthase A n=1 Tax=Ehrlichia ruminantium (strain Gardel) TaxID=302409 RepID=TRUA_EHRRG|nr:tRNA pseudouridine(38-40) synthase TruA [Ehrlichia ruminantium]Q5FGS1.1 RecName: Full=tRNA pseudouridine synthase A; AltName: Full=tRNA pseudouridine(38-40) synthase; AltName: Full=tRNA pseudouridylate synthase I; AltName: Full=tRNA-uridine isomerase I [Ehrlichia ruminantium str. Gardel]CAI27888.1 tRNA pseudouridine synthase A [Ehrlichia ruminantium str. Gardel]
MRYKIVIEYDGSNFIGWQKQNHNSNSIQEILEKAIFKFSKQHVTVYGAGRTDAGVHALGQVAHFDLTTDFETYIVRNAINYHLISHAIAVVHVEKTDTDFHARFSAKRRYYLYKIVNRYSPLTIDRNRAWLVHTPLNVENMIKAVCYIKGNHNFSSFRAKCCQSKSPVKTVDNLSITYNHPYIDINISAISFLHHQVRIIVGTLVECGKGYFPPEHIKTIMEANNRSYAGTTAPSYGLYFVKVDYS